MTGKEKYLEACKKFANYMEKHVSGSKSFSKPHAYTLRQAPRKGVKLQMAGLKNASSQYWWNQKYYDENKIELDKYKSDLRCAIDCGDGEKVYETSKNILKWGGVYKDSNRDWLEKKRKDKNESLIANYRRAISALSSDNPDFSEFGGSRGCRMNAGFTKIYALLQDDSIIYDGRVGAALGFLVTEYCVEEQFEEVPDCLSFKWGDSQGQGEKPWRNPSLPKKSLKFTKLYYGKSGERAWARWNVRANWVLVEVLKNTGGFAGESNQQEALRKLEAALFMIGYDFPERRPGRKSAS